MYVHMPYKHLSLKDMGSSKHQSTSVYVYNYCSQRNSSGHVWVLVLQVINTCVIKGLATFFVYSYCKRIVNIVPVSSISSITGIQMLMYMCKLCVKCDSHEFFDFLDREFLNRLRVDHLGKFAPRVINPLLPQKFVLGSKYHILLCVWLHY